MASRCLHGRGRLRGSLKDRIGLNYIMLLRLLFLGYGFWFGETGERCQDRGQIEIWVHVESTTSTHELDAEIIVQSNEERIVLWQFADKLLMTRIDRVCSELTMAGERPAFDPWIVLRVYSSTFQVQGRLGRDCDHDSY